MKKYDYVVLGAGVAGLVFAWKMTSEGKSVLVLEKEAQIGGLARTIKHKGFRMDFCGHRFHTNNPEVLETVLTLSGLNMRKIKKKTRIFMFGKYLTYPFELPQLLAALPRSDALISCIDFSMNWLRQKFISGDVITYKDWFVKLYGEKLYRVMCEPYTTKIWKMDPSAISADWADQRFGRPNLVRLMEKSLKKLLTMNFSTHSLEDDMLSPDGGNFYYPQGGFGQLPDAFATNAKKEGAHIVTGVTLQTVDTSRHTVVYQFQGMVHHAGFGHLISTIPIPVYYALQDGKNKRIEKAIASIRYMDILFVYLFADIPRISNDHWIYFPDPEIIFNRAVEFTNWSSSMAPKGKTCVCLDITCYQNDTTWQKSNRQLSEESIASCDRLGYLSKKRVIGSFVKRIRYAYPVYDLGYKDRLKTIVSFLENGHVHLLGRTGIFRYNNSDNSIEMALELAKQLLSGDENASLLDYTIRSVSL